MLDFLFPTCAVCGVPVRDPELHQRFHDGLREICRQVYAPDSTPEEYDRAVRETAGREALKCAHCGRPLKPWHATLHGGERVCHYDAGPDCYRRVTVYGEPLGALSDLPAGSLPEGVEGIRAAA